MISENVLKILGIYPNSNAYLDLLIYQNLVISYERFIHFVWLYFGKMWIFFLNGRFSGRIWPDWGNTAWVDMAGLGSKGLRCMFSGPDYVTYMSYLYDT